MRELFKVLSYARNLWPYYVGVTILSVIMSLTALAVPFLFKEATDLIVSVVQGAEPNYTYGIVLVLLLFAADVASTLFTNWGGYLGDVMTAKMKKQLSERYYDHLLKLQQEFFDNQLSGKIINRLNRTVNETANFINAFANNFFQVLLTVILAIVFVAFYSWEVALALVIVYPTFMWLTILTSRNWQKYQDQKNHQADIAGGRFAEVIAQMRVVKSFAQEVAEYRHFERPYQKTVDLTYRQSSYWHVMDILRRLVLNVIFLFIFGFIILQTLGGRFSLGEMFLLVQLTQMVRTPIFTMSFIVDFFQRAIAGCRDYFAVMAERPTITDRSHATELAVTDAKVTYNDVSFSYGKGEQVLHDISFTIEPGTKLALVGESGGGKTTITNLLMRLYEPQAGSITIDGVHIADVKQRSLRRNIAVVFQEPALFSGSIRQNIAYARPHATEEEVIAAAKAANAHDFISAFEKGYDSEIGERGLKLSGGQKQRIAIARALLKDAPILILDEATSSLDSKSEHLVQEALDRLMHGRTTLIIAHRLSTIAHVDTIVTLRGGRVDEIGSPDELARTDGIYAELLQLQSGRSEADKKRLRSFEITSS